MDTSHVSPPDTTKDPILCEVPGCTNRRSNAGYGRLRKVCERHHHEKYHMDYTGTRKKANSVRQQVRDDLGDLEQTIQHESITRVLEKVADLRRKYL
jgi:hypothetical protein